MVIWFEISRPFQRKFSYKRTNISRNWVWLYFAIRIYNLNAYQMCKMRGFEWEE